MFNAYISLIYKKNKTKLFNDFLPIVIFLFKYLNILICLKFAVTFFFLFLKINNLCFCSITFNEVYDNFFVVVMSLAIKNTKKQRKTIFLSCKQHELKKKKHESLVSAA